MKGSGIHYHMLSSKVEYISKDPTRQRISFVRVSRPDSSVTEFNNEDALLTEEEKNSLETRQMDCLDCHNRPAHRFRTPMESVNEYIKTGQIDASIPQIKLQAVRVLDSEYETTKEAVQAIGNKLRTFYDEKYPGFITANPKNWLTTVQAVQTIYKTTIFPEMKANWKAYPDNIGHRDWPGCFRCHNENMKNEAGKPLFSTCDKCHLILAQGKDISTSTIDFNKGLPFYHPGDQDYLKDFSDCSGCHTGGKDVYE